MEKQILNNNLESSKSNEYKNELDPLVRYLAGLITSGVNIPDDYTFTVDGDTLIVSCDKAFRENIINGLSKAQSRLGHNENMKNIRQNGNKIHADLVTPIGEISKIELEIEKYRV